MPDRELVLGPFAGEFGWELCCWNPHARCLSEQHRGPVVVQAPESSRYLYEFADWFEPVEAVPGTSDDVRGELAHPVKDRPGAQRAVPDLALYRAEKASWGRPPGHAPCKSWRRLGTEPCSTALPVGAVAVAFRPPKEHRGKVHAFKAWPEERCAELVECLLYRGVPVVSVGGPDNWHFGGLDLRGAPLAEQCALLARSRACAGPSSGTMHLAALCGARIVTWYDQPDTTSSRARYFGAWNPFAVAVAYLGSRCPPAREVLEALE